MSKSLDFSIDSNGIATINFDLQNEKVNKLSAAILSELEQIIDRVAHNQKIHTLLFRSSKKNIFIAGADINEIKDIEDEEDAYKKVIQGQEILDKIANLKIPTIAVINGACLGGGLELALACTYRVAIDNSKTILGLPEVNLGIIPGFGGTQRLPKLVGLQESLKMILSGKPVNFKKAFKIGLVDQIIREEHLECQLGDFIASVIVVGQNIKPLVRRRKIRKKRFLEEVLLGGKYLILRFVKKNLIKKTKNQYPAPLGAFEVIKQTYHCSNHNECFKVEAREFAKLAASDIAKNLIEIFFINEEIKKDQGIEGDFTLEEINKAALLGAGIMGGGIAWLFSNADIAIRIKDISQKAIAIGFKQVLKIYGQLKKIRKYNDNQINVKMAKISSTTDYEGFEDADIAIEAIIENIDIKKSALKELESHLSADAIIASNTSSLSISEMSKALKKPERFVGMHFFNPVNRMPLIEVIKGEKTSDQTVATIVKLSKDLKKTPIVVKDVAGFLVNRILLPYINEAGFLLQDGAKLQKIDQLIENFGMPMGPFILADTVGIDVGYKVAKILHSQYGKRMEVCDLLEKISKNKKLLGKKSSQGFYKYSKNGRNLGINHHIDDILKNIKSTPKNINDNDIIDRLILIMINEASRCLQENVVKNHRYLDMAMIMGAGFPPFRGGLLRYADKIGIHIIVNKLEEFSKIYGNRFKPSDLLLKMAEENQKFYQ